MRVAGEGVWQVTTDKDTNKSTRLFVLLSLSGIIFGYLFQLNWLIDNREDSLLRLVIGGIAGGVFFPAIMALLGKLFGRILSQPSDEVCDQLCAPFLLLGPLFAFPWGPAANTGAFGLALLLSLLAGLSVVLLKPSLRLPAIAILILLAVSFVGYHDSHTAYYDRGSIERILKGDADAQLRYRLLIPWLASIAHKVTDCPVSLSAFFIRVYIAFLCFLISYKTLRLLVERHLAFMAVFVHAALLPFSYLRLWNMDEVELLAGWLFLLSVVTKRFAWTLVCVLVFALNRETILLLWPWLMVYMIQQYGFSRKNKVWLLSGLVVAGVLAERFVLILIYGLSFNTGDHFTQIWGNIHSLGTWLQNFTLSGRLHGFSTAMMMHFSFFSGLWLVILFANRQLPQVLRTGVLISIPLLLVIQFLTGSLYEPRQLYLIFPLLTASLLSLIQTNVIDFSTKKESPAAPN